MSSTTPPPDIDQDDDVTDPNYAPGEVEMFEEEEEDEEVEEVQPEEEEAS